MTRIEHDPDYGDIYFVDFEPSTGHEYQKKRPAVVIQSSEQLKRSSLVTIMPLTSQIGKKLSEDILLKKDHTNCLFMNSIIKVHCISSFDKSRFIRKIGKIDTQTLDQIKAYLRNHFGL